MSTRYTVDTYQQGKLKQSFHTGDEARAREIADEQSSDARVCIINDTEAVEILAAYQSHKELKA